MAALTESSIEQFKIRILSYKQELKVKFALMQSKLSLIEKEKNRELDELLFKFENPNFPEFDFSSSNVTLCWDEHAITESLSSFCKIEIEPLPNIINPTWSSATKGSESDQIFRAHGLAIDNEAKIIYVADYFNKRIQVFDQNGQYQKSITHPDLLNHHRILSLPYYIYVTDPINKQICKINKENDEVVLSEEFEYSPAGVDMLGNLTYISNYDPPFIIYVYDNKLYKEGEIELKTSSEINEDAQVNLLDIKLTHNIIHTLLKNASHLVFLFDLNGSLLSCLIPTSLVNIAFYFSIDPLDNILISSWQDNQVLVFSKSGKLKCRIGNDVKGKYNSLFEPRGLDVLNQGVLVVCDNKDSNCLQSYVYS